MSKTEKISVVISALFIVWFILSFIDINAHNLTDQQYHQLNLIRLLEGIRHGN